MILLDFQKYGIEEIIEGIKNKDVEANGLIEDVLNFLIMWNSKANRFPIMSSGTTGDVKEMIFLKEALIASAKITLATFGLKKGDLVLQALPLTFVAGKMMLLRAIIGKLKLKIVLPTANPIKDLKDNYTFSAFTPHQLKTILIESPEKINLFSTLIIGGSKVDSNLENKLTSFNTTFYETFGMSETLTHVAIRQLNGEKKSLYFKILDGFDWDITTNDCLQVSAEHIKDSPIITKDLIERIDEDHFLWLGRVDNVINTGGIKVYPETIERKLSASIKQPFIISKRKDDKLGEKVIIYFEEIHRKYFETNPPAFLELSVFERPKEINFIDNFPRNNNGKIIRTLLNE